MGESKEGRLQEMVRVRGCRRGMKGERTRVHTPTTPLESLGFMQSMRPQLMTGREGEEEEEEEEQQQQQRRRRQEQE